MYRLGRRAFLGTCPNPLCEMVTFSTFICRFFLQDVLAGNGPRQTEEEHNMPVQIGAKAHNFSDPTGLLSDCHRHIETFLGVLQTVAGVIDRPLADGAARALDSALRYFRHFAPKHNADEEESLFPRLRLINDPLIQTALTKIDALEKDHRWAASRHDEIERLGQRCLSEGKLSAEEAASFRQIIAELSTMYRLHIHVEDETVFPLAARLLTEADRKAVGKEMAERRKKLVPAGILART